MDHSGGAGGTIDARLVLHNRMSRVDSPWRAVRAKALCGYKLRTTTAPPHLARDLSDPAAGYFVSWQHGTPARVEMDFCQ